MLVLIKHVCGIFNVSNESKDTLKQFKMFKKGFVLNAHQISFEELNIFHVSYRDL